MQIFFLREPIECRPLPVRTGNVSRSLWDVRTPGKRGVGHSVARGQGQGWRSEHELPHEGYVTEMSFKRNKPDRQIYVWQKDVKNKWTDGSEVRSGKAGGDVCPGPTAPVQA